MAWSSIVILSVLGVLVSTATAEIPGLRLSPASEHESLHPRIIGGNEVWDRCKAPYDAMVALQFETDTGTVTFCSAVMWNETVLITTARCHEQMVMLTDLNVRAVIGERDRHMVDMNEQKIAIQSSRVHQGYNSSNSDNNIAILRLETAAVLSSCVRPAIKMVDDPTACSDYDQSCMMVGWGSFSEISEADPNPMNSRLPRSAALIVLGNEVSSLLSYSSRGVDVPIGSLYADTVNQNVKACYFDWGGIVSCRRKGYNVFRGMIGEINCNSNTNPPIWVTDVSFFDSWINKCLANWEKC